MTSSARSHSAFTSTGFPARGVTGAAVDARVHPGERPALGALPEQRVGGSTPMPKRVPSRWCCTICERTGASSAPRSVVAGDGDVAVDRVDEPERAVDRVVLERSGVGRVREHALGDGRGGRPQHLASLVVAVRREVEALVRGHQVARPLAEPRIPRDGGRPPAGGDRELVGREHELRVDLVAARATRRSARARGRARR